MSEFCVWLHSSLRICSLFFRISFSHCFILHFLFLWFKCTDLPMKFQVTKHYFIPDSVLKTFILDIVFSRSFILFFLYIPFLIFFLLYVIECIYSNLFAILSLFNCWPFLYTDLPSDFMLHFLLIDCHTQQFLIESHRLWTWCSWVSGLCSLPLKALIILLLISVVT